MQSANQRSTAAKTNGVTIKYLGKKSQLAADAPHQEAPRVGRFSVETLLDTAGRQLRRRFRIIQDHRGGVPGNPVAVMTGRPRRQIIIRTLPEDNRFAVYSLGVEEGPQKRVCERSLRYTVE